MFNMQNPLIKTQKADRHFESLSSSLEIEDPVCLLQILISARRDAFIFFEYPDKSTAAGETDPGGNFFNSDPLLQQRFGLAGTDLADVIMQPLPGLFLK